MSDGTDRLVLARLRGIHYALLALVLAVLAVAATRVVGGAPAGLFLGALSIVVVAGSLATVRRPVVDDRD